MSWREKWIEDTTVERAGVGAAGIGYKNRTVKAAHGPSDCALARQTILGERAPKSQTD